MAGKVEKSNVPTSKYKVFCDHFDTSLKVETHEVEVNQEVNWKAHLTMENSDGETIELSLYREDIVMLANHLATLKGFLDGRLKNQTAGTVHAVKLTQ